MYLEPYKLDVGRSYSSEVTCGLRKPYMETLHVRIVLLIRPGSHFWWHLREDDGKYRVNLTRESTEIGFGRRESKSVFVISVYLVCSKSCLLCSLKESLCFKKLHHKLSTALVLIHICPFIVSYSDQWTPSHNKCISGTPSIYSEDCTLYISRK